MKMIYYFAFFVSLLCIGKTGLFAQTPSLQTQAPGINQTFVYNSLSAATFGANVTFHGWVNPNGVSCSVYFEYGPTTDYGHLVLAASNISGGSAVSVSATTVLYNCGDTYHCRVKVFTANGSHCGQDNAFVPGIDPTPNLVIYPQCSDNSVTTTMQVTNNNSFNAPITFSWTDGTNSGSSTQTITAGGTVTFTCNKYSTCSFYYNYTDPSGTIVYPYLFEQMPSDDQTCTQQPDPAKSILITELRGYSGNKENTAYHVINYNNSNVQLMIIVGDYQATVLVTQNSNLYIIVPYGAVDFYYVNEIIASFTPALFRDYVNLYDTVTPIYTDGSNAYYFVQNNRKDIIMSDPSNYMYPYNPGNNIVFWYPSDTTLAPSFQTIFSEEYGFTYASVPYENLQIYISDYNSPYYYDPGPIMNTLDYNCYSCTVSPGTAELMASPSAITLDANSSTNYVKISTTVPWMLSSNQSWITLNKTSGSGNDTLIFTASANTTGNKRTAAITLGDGYVSQTVAVTQSAYTLPTQNLMLHLTSDKGVVTSGTAVTEWDDQSGNRNNATQTTSANQPSYIQGAMNGLPVVRFNGSTSKLILPTSAALGIQNNPYEMFIVAQSSYTAQPEFLIAGGNTEQFEYHLNGAAGARFIPVQTSPGTYLDLETSGTYADGNPHVFEAHASSSGGGMSVDNIDGGTSATNITSSNSGNLLLGARSDGTYYLNGDIAEVLIYNAVLSSTDRNTVEHYLADKYGITSGLLPVELTSFNVECRIKLDNGN
ncbi:MAG: hypothetical protein M1480_18020 [Bacteroidetes bacterium]|nr:hypothetical protein [Bacteroidota bacterium]